MITLLWGFLAGSILALVYDILERRKDKEADQLLENIHSRKTQQLLSSREDRTNNKLANAAEFWQLIDASRRKSKENILHQKGLIRDHVHPLEAYQLIELDNLYQELVQQAYTQKLYIASVLLFGNSLDTRAFINFIDWVICQGEVTFNNVCHNPDILAHKEVNAGAANSDTLGDIFRDAYYSKARTLMPETAYKYNLQGEELSEAEIARQLPELWKSASTHREREQNLF